MVGKWTTSTCFDKLHSDCQEMREDPDSVHYFGKCECDCHNVTKAEPPSGDIPW